MLHYLVIIAVILLIVLATRSGRKKNAAAISAPRAPIVPGSLVLLDCGPNKIRTIKVLLKALNLGLADAKNLVENVPAMLMSDGASPQAVALRAALEESGARVRIADADTALPFDEVPSDEEPSEEEIQAELDALLGTDNVQQPGTRRTVTVTVNGTEQGAEWLKNNPGIQDAVRQALSQRPDLAASAASISKALDQAISGNQEGKAAAGNPFSEGSAFAKSASSPFATPATESSDENVAPGSDEYRVMVTNTGFSKARVLEVIRELWPDIEDEEIAKLGRPGFELLADDGLSRAEAERFAERLEAVGASVRIEK
ncbi:ribosomal protein L7/L12 [Silvibacterium dinghuense]|uniref:Ribosomal protein L7/L12 n=1 Tax=Silvibacterium dinghuense TaxID=1560006 RepID=A0A4Q1SC15_9BACT|nr:ribosomal protein L7/L12 [Silvibacterium dinghuense]RXS94557.1 ribosomal protein L7/L12 [Silvibacterium dinghuense]GGH15374.1 hypothetical protein GCM10011586_36410 [Silvibacterium dinghuense]